MLDATDLRLLELLQADARCSNVDLARAVHKAPSAVLERVRKLEEKGLIQSYQARLDAASVGLGLLAFIFVRAEERVGAGKTATRLAAIPGVQEVHHIAGEDCFLVKLRAASTDALGSILRDRFGAISTIRSTRTTIVLQTVKETATIPLLNESKRKRPHE